MKAAIMALAMGLLPMPALGCPICFGAAESPMIDGMNMAILALLVVTGTVLGGFATFFVYLMRRAKRAARGSGSAEGAMDAICAVPGSTEN